MENMNPANEMNLTSAPLPDAPEIRYFPPKIEFTKKESVFGILALPMGYGFIKLVAAPVIVYSDPGLGTALYLILLTVYGLLFPSEKTLNKPVFYGLNALSAVFSANVFICSNILIQLLDILFVLMIFAYSMLVKSDSRFGEVIRTLFLPDMFKASVVMPLTEVDKCGKAIKSVSDKKAVFSGIKNTLLGLLIAVPSTLIVCSLLMSADSGFADIIKSIVPGLSDIIPNIFQAAVGIPIGSFIFGMCYASAKSAADHMLNDENTRSSIRKAGIVDITAGIVSVVPVCVLYVIYFFSQSVYYLSAFTGTLPEGYSYSGYARHGFFELFGVTVVNVIIIAAFNLFCKHDSEKRPLSMRIITSVLCFFTIVLVATAVSKMLMYIDRFGLTPLRVYTTWFMIVVASIFIVTIVNQFVRFNLPKTAVIIFTLMFAALSFCRLDHQIARYNIDMGFASTYDDYEFLTDKLSAGAAPDVAGIALPDNGSLDELYNDYCKKNRNAMDSDWRGITAEEIIASQIFSKQ